MSLTIQQIITDAKRLTTRLKERDCIADEVLNETIAVNKKIEAMRQFQDEVEQLNGVANQKPHSELVANILKENRHLREVQQENRELRAALEEYRIALEHIMFKYREHTSEQIYKSRINFEDLQDKQHDEIIMKQAEKIHEMAAVMQKAALIDEEKSARDMEFMAKLRAENRGLRELLQISFKYGSSSLKTEDKTVQTDDAN